MVPVLRMTIIGTEIIKDAGKGIKTIHIVQACFW